MADTVSDTGAREAPDLIDTSLSALRRRMEQIDERIHGDTAMLKALANEVADQKRKSDTRETDSEREA